VFAHQPHPFPESLTHSPHAVCAVMQGSTDEQLVKRHPELQVPVLGPLADPVMHVLEPAHHPQPVEPLQISHVLLAATLHGSDPDWHR
jgi:hypothetical protein